MEELVMKVQELLLNIKNKNFNMEKELAVKEYLPIQKKQAIAQLIINECTENVDGVIKLNSIKQYMAYVRYMILMHTNLDYSDEDYDALCSTQYGDTTLLNYIMSYFGSDAEECSRILNLMLDDYMFENSIEVVIGKFFNGLTNNINSFASSLGNINLKGILPEGIDTEKFNAFLNTYIK